MNSIIDRLEAMPAEEKKSDIWRISMAIALDSASAYYDEMYEAVSYYLSLGFTAEEIYEQINFGSLIVEADEIIKLFNI